VADSPIEQIFSEHDIESDDQALALVPRQSAERLVIFPLRCENGLLVVAMPDPDNLWVTDQIARLTGMKVRGAKASEDVVRRCILRYYVDEEDAAPTLMEGIAEETRAPAAFEQMVAEAPAVTAINSLLEGAIAERATDVHIEPHPGRLLIRYRIDGVMYDQGKWPAEMHSQIVSRVKIMAKLDIAEKRLPQDGRFEGRFLTQNFDVRVSTVPSIFGETVVMRILPKTASMMRLRDLGLDEKQFRTMEQLVTRPYGMILAVGPTGSGKTTTLYACLMKVDRASKNIITIEDPVEYQLPRVTQMQVHPKIGLSFERGLRHIVRQDPDVLLVGEIRDLETVRMAIQSALTGHLVFSTLHCNDAVAAPMRLMDMGAEPYLVASTLSAIIAQRLVRRVCKDCKVEYEAPEDLLERLGLGDGRRKFWKGRGCATCRGTGYRGMAGVFELLPIDDDFRAAIVRKESSAVLRAMARQKGILSLRDAGMQKAGEGLTTLDEVMRALFVEEGEPAQPPALPSETPEENSAE
jgi:type II secretory ATPase GspE/PulE/Tfp pilus assembly ATPase PilB-like protein